MGRLLELTADDKARTQLFEDLLTLRRHLVRGVLEKLSVSLETADLEAVENAFDAFETCAETSDELDELVRLDLDVIDSILAATQSPIFRICMNPIMATISQWGELKTAMYRNPQAQVAGYRMLRYWLQHPDAKAIDTLLVQLQRRDEATVRHLERPRTIA